MTQNVLFYSPLAVWPVHFETELELIEQYLRSGASVTLLTCRRELTACAANPRHRKDKCRACVSRLDSGLRWLGRGRLTVDSFYRLTAEQEKEVEAIVAAPVRSRDQLRSVTLEGSEIGRAALSSVISALREPYPDVEEHRGLIGEHLRSAAVVHHSIANHIRRLRPDTFVVFNARFAELAPASQVAKSLGVDVIVHETAGVRGNYALYRASTPHDLEFWKERIDRAYDESDLPEAEKQEIALRWFLDRRGNSPADNYCFTRNQTDGRLPASFGSKPLNVAIFNSSDDEFQTVDEWKNPFYRDQNDGVLKIVKALEPYDNVRVYLRVHPHLRAVDNSQTRFLRHLPDYFPDNLEVVAADSPVSTYGLMDASDLVITFGSTVGVEALFNKRPSVLMGRALYEGLDAIIRPASHQELVSVLDLFARTGATPPTGDPERSLWKYGFYFQTFGHPFEFVRRDGAEPRMVRDGRTYSVAASLLARALNKFGL